MSFMLSVLNMPFMLSVVMLSVVMLSRYAECRYAECCGAVNLPHFTAVKIGKS